MYIVLGVIARWLKSTWHAFGYWRDALAMLAVVKVTISPYHQGLERWTTPFHFHVLQWKHLYALGFCVCHNNVHFPLPHKASSSKAYTTQQDAQYASRGPNLAGTHDRVARALPAVAAGTCGGIANSLCRRKGCGASIIYFITGCCLTCSGRGILVPCATHSAQPFCSHLLIIFVCICHGWMKAYWRRGVCVHIFLFCRLGHAWLCSRQYCSSCSLRLYTALTVLPQVSIAGAVQRVGHVHTCSHWVWSRLYVATCSWPQLPCDFVSLTT